MLIGLCRSLNLCHVPFVFNLRKLSAWPPGKSIFPESTCRNQSSARHGVPTGRVWGTRPTQAAGPVGGRRRRLLGGRRSDWCYEQRGRMTDACGTTGDARSGVSVPPADWLLSSCPLSSSPCLGFSGGAGAVPGC